MTRPARYSKRDTRKQDRPTDPDSSAYASTKNTAEVDLNKRRETTTSFFYAERREALDPALLQPSSIIEQENTILTAESIGKAYQLIVKDYNIAVRDNRIRDKDKRIRELEEDEETKTAALIEAGSQKQALTEQLRSLSVVSEAQAAQLEELISTTTENRAALVIKDNKIRALQKELEAQRFAVEDLENRRMIDRLLEWICRLLKIAPVVRKPSANTFPFLRLPGELRNAVYKKCLVAPRPIDLWPIISHDAPRRTSRDSLLNENLRTINISLLRVSQQVNRETIGILYGCNRFRFSDHHAWTMLEGFLLNLNRNCRYLTNISIRCPDWLAYFHAEDSSQYLDLDKIRSEMQLVLDRFRLVVDSPIGPTSDPVRSTYRVIDIMAKLQSLQSFTMIVPHDGRLHIYSADFLSKMMSSKDRLISSRQRLASTPKRAIVFLRRPEYRKRVIAYHDLDDDMFMGRRDLTLAALDQGVPIKFGRYGSRQDRVSYVLDNEDEDDYDISVPQFIGEHARSSLRRTVLRLLGF